jgi:site-specific DNA recombinase
VAEVRRSRRSNKPGDFVTETLPRIGVYVRLSLAKGDTVSIQKQREACEARARAMADSMQYDPRPWTQGGDYFEDTESAYQSQVVRPAFDELKRRLPELRGGVVIFYALDRLVRRTKQWLDFYELADEFGVGLVCITVPIDTRTEMGRLFATLIVQIGQLESGTIGSRVRSAQDFLIKDGRFRGGTPNFGYQSSHREGHGWVLAIQPQEADTLRMAAKLILDGSSLTEAASTLNRLGRTSRKGGPLRGPNLSKWLRNPATGGDSIWNGDFARDRDEERTTWIEEPVLDPSIWRQVVAALDSNHPTGKGSGSRPGSILLRGLVRCGLCDSRMSGTNLTKGTYSCPSASDGSGTCRYNIITKQGLEAFISAWVLARFTPEAIAAGEEVRRRADGSDDKADALRTQIKDVSHELDVLEEDRAAGLYDTSAALDRYRKRYRTTAEKLGRFERELTSIEVRQARVLSKSARPITDTEWSNLSIEQRRTTVRAVVDYITIGPSSKGRRSGPKFDARRVTITPLSD